MQAVITIYVVSLFGLLLLVFERKDEKGLRTPRIGKVPEGTHCLHFLLSSSLQTMAESLITAGRLRVCFPLGEPIVSDLSCLCPLFPVITDQTEILLVQLPGQSHEDQAHGDHVPSPRPFHHPHCGGIQTLQGNTAATPTRLLLPSFQLSVVRALQPFIIVKEH